MSYGGNRPRRKNKRPEKRWRNIAAQFSGRRTRSAGGAFFRAAWGAGGEGDLWGAACACGLPAALTREGFWWKQRAWKKKAAIRGLQIAAFFQIFGRKACGAGFTVKAEKHGGSQSKGAWRRARWYPGGSAGAAVADAPWGSYSEVLPAYKRRLFPKRGCPGEPR